MGSLLNFKILEVHSVAVHTIFFGDPLINWLSKHAFDQIKVCNDDYIEQNRRMVFLLSEWNMVLFKQNDRKFATNHLLVTSQKPDNNYLGSTRSTTT